MLKLRLYGCVTESPIVSDCAPCQKISSSSTVVYRDHPFLWCLLQAGEKGPRIKADKRDNDAAQTTQKSSSPVTKKRRSALQRRDGPSETRNEENTDGINMDLLRALEPDLSLLNQEVRPPVAYKLRAQRRNHVSNGQDIGVRQPCRPVIVIMSTQQSVTNQEFATNFWILCPSSPDVAPCLR